MAEDKFTSLYNQLRNAGQKDCTNEDLVDLVNWSTSIKQKPKAVKPLIEFTYIIFGIIVLVFIIAYIIYLYTKPIVLLDVLSMQDPKNFNDGIELEISEGVDGADGTDEEY